MSNAPEWLPIVPWIALAGAIACLWAAIRAARCKRLVNDLPTSKTTGVFIGLVEVKGTAESEAPLTSYLAEVPCICYSWSVEEHWSRTVTETYTDNEGRTQTRTRHESGWTNVASGSDMQDFYLKDDCGVIRVNPAGAKIEPQTTFDETCGPLNGLYYGKGPGGAVADSDFRRRFSEQAIVLHAPLYVMGQARERTDIVAAEIAADKSAPMFLISTRSEKEISSGFGCGEWGWGFFGLVLCLVATYVFLMLGGGDPNPLFLIPAGVCYCGIAAGCWVWMVYNSIIDLRQRVRQGWSQVDVQLKRRHDLIPNLVKAVEGLRDYEGNLQTELATLRSQLGATAPGQPGPDYQATGKTLIAIAERYPEITAQQSFLNLQQNLSETEQRIALARGYFNEIATYYNTRLQIVPDKFIASLGGLKEQPLMLANDFERAPVEVSLATDEAKPAAT